MKKVFLTLAVVASVLTACKGEKKEKVEVKEEVIIEKVADLNNVDVTSSVITWKGTKPTGAHNGTIMLSEGSLVLEDGNLEGGEFVVDMSSIKNEDLDAKGGAKLVGHLTSPDFFDVAKYPMSKFVITSVEEKEDKLHVTGNLTLKDVTKSITIPAMLMTEGDVTTFKSETFTIDRADFNVKYGSKKFFDNLKDKFIDDLMELSFTVKTK
ncbi:YceI family protein [uncultured Polaribacter sp.]|uniref:YceI family protein n=1 Tax=uncultured Polaribacter sp. TaxID=174711 RepID=UPI00260EA0C8|nr:YceI family protein [uncultured Polaribacter sp.]